MMHVRIRNVLIAAVLSLASLGLPACWLHGARAAPPDLPRANASAPERTAPVRRSRVTSTGTEGAPTVQVDDVNSGAIVERDLCLTVAMGAGAAAECGDLRLAHALPTIRTLNRARTPTLIYNSQHARPYPLVAANVTVPSGTAADRVIATLRVGGRERARSAWPASEWTSGSTRRIVIGYDAAGDATGIYPYELKVFYDAAGRHVETVNRLEHATRFGYTEGRLSSITVPPEGTARAYEFVYDGAEKLDEVLAPGAGDRLRITRIRRAGARTTITDPDGHSVHFDSDASGRIAARTDRRGYATAFAYDAGSKLRESRLPMGENQTEIVNTLRALESLGLARGAGGSGAVDAAQAYALLDGPRDNTTDATDTTAFWLDRWGAPRKIRDALGNETTLFRENGTYPALVTRVEYPKLADGSRRVVAATYTARGSIESSTDSSTVRTEPDGTTRYATTRYAYDDLWPDFVARITLPEGEATEFAYDPNNGNRIWQKPSGDAARADTVRFAYNARGLLESVKTPLSPADRIEYDGRGNVRATRTPKGFYSLFYKDELGRDTLVLSPIDTIAARDSLQVKANGATQRIVYDAVDQVVQTESYGPSLSYATNQFGAPSSTPAERLLVRNFYNAEGNLEQVDRWASPDSNRIGTISTAWRYDAAGRAVAELAPGSGTFTTTVERTVCEDPLDVFTCREETYDSTYTVEYKDSTVYDPAGNAVKQTTRRGHTIAMQYDALNRLRQRNVPAVPYPQQKDPYGTGWRFPLYNKDAAGGLTIGAEVADYTYDAVGNLLTASNGDAQVKRSYHLNAVVSGYV